MANEITTTGKLTYKNGVLKAEMSGSSSQDMAGEHYQQGVQDLSTSEESVSKGDIVTLGYVYFKNIGESGVISVGGVTTKYDFSISPGESVGPMRWATNAIFVKGDASGCRLEYLLLEL